ncbi:MAG: TetR/AcrR family transcriptional regulator [Bacteroidales bacterium]|jgi:AcrR family transcriptional regulator|nr:TetR/AcrR family transcriptional regulator [Bacteroidales bacterium]MCU0410629.1 TetR/AcrR family transcriptional regulator [Bacteroidales bacterium]
MNQEDCDDRIITGAAELFRVAGIKAVTMDDIARELGISKRTIYEKYGDKDELLLAVMKCMVFRQRKMIEETISSSPNVIAAIFRMINMMREHTRSMNPVIFADLKKYHSKVLDKLKDSCELPDYKGSENIVAKGIEQGLFRDEIDVEIVSRCFQGLGQMISDVSLFPPDKYLQRDVIKSVIVNYMRGISTPAGAEIIKQFESEF